MSLLYMLVLAHSVVATHLLHPRQSSSVDVVSLSKNVNATGGTGDVAASGKLPPFGDIGVGCGINWAEEVSYGGGLTAGSPIFGLGGGFNIQPEVMDVGLGIGVTKSNSSANIQFSGSANGSFSLEFAASSPFACVPSTKDGQHVLTCATTGRYH